jgi:thiol-disulfide isomerase/thioredoxin
MKTITATLSLLSLFLFCNAQNKSGITTKEIPPRAGFENLYVYQPPANLLLPDKMEALVIYQSKHQYYHKYIAVNKVGNRYQFLFKPPDSTSVLIMGMVDAKVNNADYSALMATRKKVVDNSGAGFIFYLHNNQGKPFADEKIVLADLLRNYAAYYLDTKTEEKFRLKMYQDSYKLHPELVNEDSYLDYLTLLNDESEDAARPQLMAYIKRMEKVQNNETKWLNAVSAYSLLKMDVAQQELEHKILMKYPNGEFAKQKFWKNFYAIYKRDGDTEQSILDSMNRYITRFNDSSNEVKGRFYSKISSLFFDKKEWANVVKYEELGGDKFSATFSYDYFAREMCGGQLDSKGTDLEIAKNFSKKAIGYTEERIKNSTTNDGQDLDLKGALNKYINTYALILYKLGQYDSAFYYQDSLYQQGNELNVEGMERYAAYAVKIKGTQYARQVVEEQLLSGVTSPVMVKQLQSIYQQLNLPENEFNALQKKSNLLFKQKTAAIIRGQLGTIIAKDFTLKNILGRDVSLSSFKNKVVVLDFWATWCGPCIASFPAMQEAINKYKEDSEVVFLFIDVWENTVPKKMQETATKLIKDNNYSFNVLLDVKNTVVNGYRIKSIPTKIVIDKKGYIISMGNSSNIELEVERARN